MSLPMMQLNVALSGRSLIADSCCNSTKQSTESVNEKWFKNRRKSYAIYSSLSPLRLAYRDTRKKDSDRWERRRSSPMFSIFRSTTLSTKLTKNFSRIKISFRKFTMINDDNRPIISSSDRRLEPSIRFMTRRSVSSLKSPTSNLTFCNLTPRQCFFLSAHEKFRDLFAQIFLL